MSEGSQSQSFVLQSKPGVKRDGTRLDNEYYTDSQWVRFQRGKPRKIGGYAAISDMLTGPIRALLLSGRAPNKTAHVFSGSGVLQLTFDNNGVGGGIVDRTPAGFTSNVNYTWQSDVMYDSTGGAYTAIVCAATPDLDGLDSDTAGPVYTGDINATGALTAVSDGAPITVSGGLVVLQPCLFVYGSNGLIRNSNANDFSAATGWTGTNANRANVAGTKVVKGLPLRGGGSSPAGLFWALDALIRVTYVGGTALWKYDPISAAISVMSKSAIVEFDGVYYWPGVDRFFVYTGVVQELPNQMNANWFFDNLNYAQRQKVWGMKVPRFGEIWWFYPRGSSTECNAAIIFNVREQTWYDTLCARSAGASAQVFPRPIMAGGEAASTTLLKYTVGAGTFAPGNVITGGTSAAVGTIYRMLTGQLNLVNVTGTFVNGETVSAGAVNGTLTAVPAAQELNVIWQHEYGVDRTLRQDTTAIEAYFQTGGLQWMTGGPAARAPGGPDVQTRLTRLEPDFVMSADMTFQVVGRSYAQSSDVTGDPFTFDGATEFVDPREQRRELAVKFTSNVRGGTFEMGSPLVTVEPGDARG